jgi:two-component system sensor histidine kinase BaeS
MFNLRVQVFLAFLCFAVLLTLGAFFYSRMSFEHSFARYMEQKESERNSRLISALALHYQVYGNWDNFKLDKRQWDLLIAQYRRVMRSGDAVDLMPPFALPEEIQAWLMPNNRFYGRDRTRYTLLDNEQRLIAGEQAPRERYFLSRIQIPTAKGQKLVGYLGTPINPVLRDLFDNEFVDRQQTHFVIMSMVALVIAFICAIPLSYLLTKRVKVLANYVQLLSKGRYHERIPTKGQDEISTLAEHLNHLSHTLEQSEQTRKRWVADISHELRTPLAVLKADLEALEDGVRQFDQKSIMRLQKHATRLNALVNDLYELSLTDIGAMSYRKTNCNLNEIIGDICTSLEEKFTQAGLSFSLKLPTETITLLADPQRLQQLLLNLLHNSINYTNNPGQVQLALIREDNQAQITIDDSAPGVDPELHEKLFERLYRAESSRSRETGGAGLGLSICRNIVEAHQGKIQITTSPMGGLKVSISFPLQHE